MSNSALRRRAAARSIPSCAIARLISSAIPVAAEPGAEEQETLLGKLLPGDAQGAVDAGERHAGGALDVVVEGANLIAISREDRDCVEVSEILPLDAAFRIELLNCRHKLVDKDQILFAAHALLAQTLVKWVVEQDLVVGANVEDDGQTVLRRTPAQAV